MIRWKQEVDGFCDFGSTSAILISSPMRSHTAPGVPRRKVSEFSMMLEAAFREGGVHLVVAPIDYSENIRVLVKEFALGNPGCVKTLLQSLGQKPTFRERRVLADFVL